MRIFGLSVGGGRVKGFATDAQFQTALNEQSARLYASGMLAHPDTQVADGVTSRLFVAFDRSATVELLFGPVGDVAEYRSASTEGTLAIA